MKLNVTNILRSCAFFAIFSLCFFVATDGQPEKKIRHDQVMSGSPFDIDKQPVVWC